jgi:hypothetical protein
VEQAPTPAGVVVSVEATWAGRISASRQTPGGGAAGGGSWDRDLASRMDKAEWISRGGGKEERKIKKKKKGKKEK